MDEITNEKVIGYPAAYIDIKGYSGISFSPGKKGNALCTDGLVEDLSLRGIENTCVCNAWKCSKSGVTSAVWVKFLHIDSDIRSCFIGKPSGLRLKMFGPTKLIVGYNDGYTYYLWRSFDPSLGANVWIHVVVTFSEQAGYKLYINGNLHTDSEVHPDHYAGHYPCYAHIGINSGGESASSRARCCIDELYTWPEIKSQTFITNLYNQY